VQPFAGPANHELDRSLVRGLAWTASAKWLSQLLTWPANLIVARILSPDDFGLITMAMVFMGLVGLVNEFGLGSAVVRHRDLSSAKIAQLSGLCVVFGLAAALISAAAAYPLAVLYHAPALRWVVLALSGSFLITGFKTVPLSLLQRDLRFNVSATTEAVGTLIQSVTLVFFAWIGLQYWALVLSLLLSSLATTILINIQRPHALAWPRRRDIAAEVAFGGHLVSARVAWYLYTNADFFIVGRVLGKTALGIYSIGWDFATMPVEKVAGLIGGVSGPVFSAVQSDYVAARRYVSRLLSGIALLTFPAGIGLALVARDFVLLALGEKWEAAIVPLQILSLYGAFRSIMPIVSQAGTYFGLSRFVMRNSIAAAIILPVAFLVGARWGTSGVAMAWVLAYPLVAIPLCIVVFRRIGLPRREAIAAIWPAVSSAALMVPVVLLVRYGLGDQVPAAARLALQVLAGAATYCLAVFSLHRKALRDALDIFPRFRKKQSGAPGTGGSVSPIA
jgi:PST family polysaccharide transporter